MGYIRADDGCGGERVALPLTSGAAADKSTLIKDVAWSDNYICSLWRVSLQRGITSTPQTPPPSRGFYLYFPHRNCRAGCNKLECDAGELLCCAPPPMAPTSSSAMVSNSMRVTKQRAGLYERNRSLTHDEVTESPFNTIY